MQSGTPSVYKLVWGGFLFGFPFNQTQKGYPKKQKRHTHMGDPRLSDPGNDGVRQWSPRGVRMPGTRLPFQLLMVWSPVESSKPIGTETVGTQQHVKNDQGGYPHNFIAGIECPLLPSSVTHWMFRALEKYNMSSRDKFQLKPRREITNILEQIEVAGKQPPRATYRQRQRTCYRGNPPTTGAAYHYLLQGRLAN